MSIVELVFNISNYECLTISPISLISLNPTSMNKMQFCSKEATLPKISQHRLTLLKSSSSWKKFLTLPSITLYEFIQIHSLTLPSPKTTTQASSIVRILGQEMLFPIFQLVKWWWSLKFRPYDPGFSKSLGHAVLSRQDQTSQNKTFLVILYFSRPFIQVSDHQYFQEEV